MRSFFVCLFLVVTATVTAGSAMEHQSQYSSLYTEILERLAARHYSGQKINDELSRQYLEQYIEMLDPSKSYFLQSDINEFSKWETRLDDLARRGDVEPGFVIFERLRSRGKERLNYGIEILRSDYKFDYSTNETILLDNDKRAWFATTEDANAYWLKRVQDQMIRLLLNDKDEQSARELLIKRFQNQIKQLDQRDDDDIFQLYVNALASLYDPHTSYFSPRTMENFQISMSLSLEGIGAVLQSEDDYTKVVRVIPGGPADVQGILQPEDKIVGVAQDDAEMVDVIGWRLDDVVDLIRGPKDSTVRLEIIPASGESADTIKQVSIVRDKVKLEEQAAKSRLLNVRQGGHEFKLGIIEIPAFYMDFDAYRARDPDFKSTTRDVAKLLHQLDEEKVDGIVLDLRNNGGGSLHEATTLTDLFIDRGPVVQIRDSNQRVYRDQRATSKAIYNGPLLVVINRLSASASEIFAGALQDYGRALVVGSQSFGKGTVQDVTGLSSGQLKLTVSKFYRVSGDSTQHRGVIPDINLPSALNLDEVGESQDKHALPWDQIHAVPFKRYGDLGGFIAPLNRYHENRATHDPDYLYMVKRIELGKRWDDEKELSLNLEKRRARNNEWDKAVLALENQRRLAKGLQTFPDVAAWKAQREPDDDNIQESDPLLFEAGNILTDLIRLESRADDTQLVQLKSAQAS